MSLGLEALGIVAVMSVVFAIPYVTVATLIAAFGGILTPRSGDHVVAVTEVHGRLGPAAGPVIGLRLWSVNCTLGCRAIYCLGASPTE